MTLRWTRTGVRSHRELGAARTDVASRRPRVLQRSGKAQRSDPHSRMDSRNCLRNTRRATHHRPEARARMWIAAGSDGDARRASPRDRMDELRLRTGGPRPFAGSEGRGGEACPLRCRPTLPAFRYVAAKRAPRDRRSVARSGLGALASSRRPHVPGMNRGLEGWRRPARDPRRGAPPTLHRGHRSSVGRGAGLYGKQTAGP
jgi:hypothetical protein